MNDAICGVRHRQPFGVFCRIPSWPNGGLFRQEGVREMIEVRNPVTSLQDHREAESESIALDLNGKKIGLLNNSKPNVDLLFDHLAGLLLEHIRPRSITKFIKPTVTTPVSKEIENRIVQESELVINGVGD